MNLLARRKLTNRVALTLSLSAMAFGLIWLVWMSALATPCASSSAKTCTIALEFFASASAALSEWV